MLDWYLTHVYVLPWWAYVAPLYFTIGLLCMYLANKYKPSVDGAWVWVWSWPLMIALYGALYSGWCFIWLIGLTDNPPFSLSEGGYIE